MAEKRKLPPRAGREPAAKRRVSEAATPQSSKKKAATPRAPTPPPPEPVEAPLPTKLRDGEGLPVTRERQPSNLSDKDYQSIAESAVLLASLERSKKKWLSDGILVRYYTKPKKTKREQIVQNNPPKESMSKLGACDVTIGPHLFGAMIYTVKDPNSQTTIQYAPPRPMVHYNHQNNFQQQRYQYPSPSNQGRPPYPPAPARPPQGYHGHQPHYQQRGPQHAPPPSGQRPPQPQNGQQPAKPSPDPVIQMLATRAAADPELKALMRVVASSQASQEQLRAFQAHIDELNAIIKAREQQEQRQQNAAGPPVSAQPPPTSQNQMSQQQQSDSGQKKATESKTASQGKATPAPSPSQPEASSKQGPSSTSTTAAPDKPAETATQSGPQTPARPQNDPPAAEPAKASIKSESSASAPSGTPSAAPQPAASTPPAPPGPVGTPAPPTGSQVSPSVRPTQAPGNFQPPPPRPGPPMTPSHQSPHGHQPPLQSRPPQYGSPASYQRQPAPLPPQMRNFKAVVFEFTSPLTPYGSSTSGHAGSGDRYLFPEYSILEWQPAENTMLASFLVVKKVDPNQPFPIEPASENGPTKTKGKGTSKPKKGDTKDKGIDSPANQTPGTPLADTPQKLDAKPNGMPETPGTPSDTPVNEANLKEYWQPVTWRIHSTNPRLFEPLTRVVKPADEVRKYMNEIMDRAERAPDGFPALRLPREEARDVFESEGTPASGTDAAASRGRASRAKSPEEESGVEFNGPELEEDDELLDFYGSPVGLPPLKV